MTNRLDLSDRPGIGLREVLEALQDYVEQHGERPDVIDLPKDVAAPFVTKVGTWGSFHGIPIVYVGEK